MFKYIDTILFDIDGTLIDTDEIIIASYREVFKRLRPDYKLTREEELSFLGPTLISMFKKYFKEDFETCRHIYHDFFLKNMMKFAKVYDGAISLLEHLKNRGYKLGVVTSRLKFSANEVLEKFNLLSYFDIVIGLDDVINPKPSPEGINKAMNLLKSKIDNTIYIGDNKSDLIAGQSAKIKTGLVTWSRGRENHKENADFFIDSYHDFIKEFIDE